VLSSSPIKYTNNIFVSSIFNKGTATMKLINYGTAFLFALSSVLATPMPATEDAAPAVVPRDGNTARCTIKNEDVWTYKFDIRSTGVWDDDWGHGLLDNLRGQCGWIDRWGFDYNAEQGHASFVTSLAIRNHCVEDAIWLASAPTGAIGGVNCQWPW
jgi:hypothetical protein